jgi:hypothetical protein
VTGSASLRDQYPQSAPLAAIYLYVCARNSPESGESFSVVLGRPGPCTETAIALPAYGRRPLLSVKVAALLTCQWRYKVAGSASLHRCSK